mmetsp:Transcript_51382/g.92314  ORF Transcript_51382/g.92314 Transcript_51382/m.92314 type:complete len:216 (-) Transcript_51382:20-667(-)
MHVHHLRLSDTMHPVLSLHHLTGHPVEFREDHGVCCSQGQTLTTGRDTEKGDADSLIFLELLDEGRPPLLRSFAVNSDILGRKRFELLLEAIQHDMVVGEEKKLDVVAEEVLGVLSNPLKLGFGRLLEDLHQLWRRTRVPIKTLELLVVEKATNFLHLLGVQLRGIKCDPLPSLFWQLRQDLALEAANHDCGREQCIQLALALGTHPLHRLHAPR